MTSPTIALNSWKPYLFGFFAIFIFSFSFPMTKIAVSEMNPYFVVSLRTLIAGLLGLLWLSRKIDVIKLNARVLRTSIVWQIVGAVVGFPVLSALALKSTGSSHAALVIAITPILTAVFISILNKRKRSISFWAYAIAATITVLLTVILNKGITLELADLLLFVGSILVALGYTFGGSAAAIVGGATSISLATSLTLPLSITGVIYFMPTHWPTLASLLCVIFLGTFSMFIGMILWYEGLALGNSEQVSLIQSIQLFLTYIVGFFLLQERVALSEILPSILVVCFIIGSKRSR